MVSIQWQYKNQPIAEVPQKVQKKALKDAHKELSITEYSSVMKFTAVIGAIALFIIGALGATGGYFTPAQLGWTTVAVGGFGLVAHLNQFKKMNKVGVLLSSLSFISLLVLGILGGRGYLTVRQIGLGIIGTQLTSLPLNVYFYRAFNRKIEILKTKALQKRGYTFVVV